MYSLKQIGMHLERRLTSYVLKHDLDSYRDYSDLHIRHERIDYNLNEFS